MIIKNAWRNIWRNKRRTIITASSVFFAVFLALIMRSAQLGTLYKIVDDTLDSYSGAVQVHKAGYWDEKTINNSFERDTLLENKIAQTENIKIVVPRLESFALASSGQKSKGVMVVGIQPEIENNFTGVVKHLKQGEYFTDNEQAVLLGDELAKYLGLSVNDTVVLIGQGYHGVSAAGKYRIKGILHFVSPALNRGMLYLPLQQAQNLYGATNRLSSLNLALDDNLKSIATANTVRKLINNKDYEVMPWQDLMQELVQMIQSKNASSAIMLGLLYMIVGFGVLGTIIMMTSERMREFGILIAIGMHKYLIALVVSVETLFIGFIGLILGALSSLPIIWYYAVNPIRLSGDVAQMYTEMGLDPVMKFLMEPTIFFNQLLVVCAIVLVAIIYPWFKLLKIEPVKAMKMN
jgi:ABC-type lipoprotein release transport system permease subunit